MSVEQNKAVVRRFAADVLNGARFDAADELFTPGFTIHGLPPGLPENLEGLRLAVTLFHAAFPDWQDTEDDIVAEGDRVVLRFTGRGTHRGEFLGLAPTGRRVAMPGIAIYRLEDGRIAEDWVQLDTFTLMQQLGGAPA